MVIRMYMSDPPFNAVSSACRTPLLRRLVAIALYACAVPLGLLAALMLAAGCRWLVLESMNGWPFSLSLALLGGGSLAALLTWGSWRLARLTSRCS